MLTYSKPASITRVDILICSNLASLYSRPSDNGKVPLFVFLWFLSLSRREISSVAFEDWIRERYEGNVADFERLESDCKVRQR